MTVAENLMFERLPQRRGIVDYRETNRRAAELLEEVGLDVQPTTQVARLGVAQMQLVEIAKTLVFESKLLILDEPTATLTSKEVDRLFDILRRLKARGVTIVYISHRLQEIGEIGDRVTVLRDGQLVATRPLAGLTIPEIVRMMVGRSAHGRARLSRRRRSFGRSAAGRRPQARCEEARKSRSRSARAKSSASRGWWAAVGRRRRGRYSARTGRSPGDIYVEGERVVIDSPRDAVQAGLCLMTEDRKGQGLLLGMSCAENITITDLAKISRHGLIERDEERGAATRLVQDLRIKTPSIDQTVRNFSGGNQQKVVIAKWLFRGSKVLLCDEPTRGIDVGARAEIYDLLWTLAADGRGVLFISSDLPELIAICHRILVFAKGRVVGEVGRAEFDQHRILSMAYEEYRT